MTDMSKKTEALKLAEDALKRVRTQDMELVQLSMIALAAIQEALAEQPAQHKHISYVCPQCYWSLEEQPAQQEPVSKEAIRYITATLAAFGPDEAISMTKETWAKLRGAIKTLAEQPAPATPLRGQEPVAVPTTSYEHRKFVLVGRDWYERFAAFHDDCQIGEQLTWQEKTIRQQGYENGWNDAQRYLKEPQATSPTPAQRTWVHATPWRGLTDEDIASLDLSAVTVKDAISDVRAVEAKLKEKNA